MNGLDIVYHGKHLVREKVQDILTKNRLKRIQLHFSLIFDIYSSLLIKLKRLLKILVLIK
jgi:hypothetical protein